MAKSNNPYHLWLGLPEETRAPNFYQLLLLQPTVTDKAAITKAAKTQLAKLKTVDAGKHQVVLEKIKKRVVEAHAVLSDDVKRTSYDKGLLAKLTSQSQPKPVSEKAPPPAAGVEQTTRGNNDQQAIPMAVPVDSDPTSAGATAEIPTANPVPSVKPTIVGPADEASAPIVVGDLSEIPKPKKYVGPRKRSMLVPILSAVAGTLAVVGSIYFVMNMDRFVRHTPKQESKTASLDAAAVELAKKELEAEKKHKDYDPKKVPAASAQKEPVITDPDKRTTSLRGDDQATPIKKPRSNTESKEQDVSLDFAQQVRLRRHLTNVKNAMIRRDKMTADNEIENAKLLFQRFADDPKVNLAKDQMDLQQAVESTAEVKQLLEGFWRQVISSIPEIPGGQEIKVGETITSFVEGQVATNPMYVIVRAGGNNRRFPIEELPAGLAMALAKQGTKEDVPTWRMQQAAFYAVHADQDDLYRERAFEMAEEAAKDGHNTSSIEMFVDFEFESFGIPDERIPSPDEEFTTDEMGELVRRLGVNDLGKMRPLQAKSMVDALLEDSLGTDDPQSRAVRLMAAYHAARQSLDAFLVNDVLGEIDLWVDEDRDALMVVALEKMAKQIDEMDRLTARRFVEMVLLLSSDEEIEIPKRVIGQAKKACENHSLDHLLSKF